MVFDDYIRGMGPHTRDLCVLIYNIAYTTGKQHALNGVRLGWRDIYAKKANYGQDAYQFRVHLIGYLTAYNTYKKYAPPPNVVKHNIFIRTYRKLLGIFK